MGSVPGKQRILTVASDLWKERGGLSLDQVDATFYWIACRYEEFLGPVLHSQDEEPSLLHLRGIYRSYPN